MMRQILNVDFNTSQNIWVIQLGLPDGQRGEAKFTPDAFKSIRQCPMGQFLLHAWLGRANMHVPEMVKPPEEPKPPEEKEKVA
jgi:hypothetical protein